MHSFDQYLLFLLSEAGEEGIKMRKEKGQAGSVPKVLENIFPNTSTSVWYVLL